MNRKEKEKVYNKFKENKAQEEKRVIMNKGESVIFGDTTVYVKSLEWDASNEFEDAMKQVFLKLDELMALDLDDITKKVKKVKMEDVFNVLISLLRDDLLLLAGKATLGKINLAYIREHKATKDNVIEVVFKAFEVNYRYAKNFIALSKTTTRLR